MGQFGKLGCLVWEEESEVVDNFVDTEVQNGEVAEVEGVGLAFFLMVVHQVRDLLFVALHQFSLAILFFLAGGRATAAK